MHFLSDAIAEIEGLLEVNRDFCKKQMAEKASPALPTNCAVVPLFYFIVRLTGRGSWRYAGQISEYSSEKRHSIGTVCTGRGTSYAARPDSETRNDCGFYIH